VLITGLFGSTRRCYEAHGVKVTFTPEIEVDIREHITPATKLVGIETPSNPTLRLVDIRSVATATHEHGISRHGRQHLPLHSTTAPTLSCTA
jgi:cystathionine gamma-lyase